MHNFICNYICNYISNFLYFFELEFFLKTKITLLIIFNVFHIIIISITLYKIITLKITLKSNFIKERRMYEHVWTYFIQNYVYELCL